MYILTHKTYLEEKIHKIMVFMENGDRFIQLDSTFTLSCFNVRQGESMLFHQIFFK
jgi:hypothetical protein